MYVVRILHYAFLRPTHLVVLIGFAVSLGTSTRLFGQKVNVQDLIRKSVQVNDRDFQAAPNYNFKERDRDGNETKTYRVTMIEGTPYQRLIEINGKPLPSDKEKEEEKKQERAVAERRAESPEKRQSRIAAYQKERKRDHAMMDQLTSAFNFSLTGRRRVRRFDVYALRATPKPSYKPPSMELQVLKGMQGELWIDSSTYHWVRVTARVMQPVSIEGFLAEVEPGTEFEMEMSPVEKGVWQVSHFEMRSHAKVLHMFDKSSSEDETYYDYERIRTAQQQSKVSKKQ